MSRLRRRVASGERERGFSLVELTVSMTIFGGLMAIITGVFIASLNQSKDALARADSADSARLAISQLDAQIRSGSVIDDPETESFASTGVEAGFSVRILTERGGDSNCVQWRVYGGSLQYRTWPAWTPGSATEWTQVATGLMAPETPLDAFDTRASTHKPFVLVTPSTGNSVIKSLAITLRVKATGTRDEGKPVLVSTTVTGRNTIFGHGGLECDNVPAA
jgi:prepilin-type N-terminal cleavage/methylation domain-containing protein